MCTKIKNNVAELRKAVGKTQSQLAEEVGITVTHMQNIEYGDSAPSIYLAKRITKALESEVDKVFPDNPA